MSNYTIRSRLKHAWNAFFNKDPTKSLYAYAADIGMGYSYRPDRTRFSRGNERSIISAIYNRIALDAAAVDFYHVQLDKDDRFVSIIPSKLNDCLTVEANLDQSARPFRQDIVLSMLDEGCIAIVPVDTTLNPDVTDSYDIETMRVGKIREWYPQHVKCEVYNERNGKKETLTLSKKMVAIIENPFYAVMNEPNSTLKRLIRKLNILDAIDEQSGSGKLDLIIQLPYTVKGETKRQQAEKRRQDIENQLVGSKYGIAYTDGTERITQLNRPVENNLLKQIEYLREELFSQLGITQAILNGSANDSEMLNYYNRVIEPILTVISEEMIRKFLTKTARTQKKSIKFFRDPFKLVPVLQLAEIADKMTRNEIVSSNEFRQVIGLKPSDDPRADQLRNSNINQTKEEATPPMEEKTDEGEIQNG